MQERLLIGPGSPPSPDPVHPELSPPPEPCPSFWRFSITTKSLPSDSLATDNWPLATFFTVVRGPVPAGYCLTPTTEMPKTERGPIATSGPSISVCHRTRRFLRTNRSVSSPLAVVHRLTIPL